MEEILNYFGVQSSSSLSHNILLILSIIILELILRYKKTNKPQSILYMVIFLLMLLVGVLVFFAKIADKVLPQKIKNKID